MFKKEKDLQERSRALLKNKETKKLKADVRINASNLCHTIEIILIHDECAASNGA